MTPTQKRPACGRVMDLLYRSQKESVPKRGVGCIGCHRIQNAPTSARPHRKDLHGRCFKRTPAQRNRIAAQSRGRDLTAKTRSDLSKSKSDVLKAQIEP